MMDKMYEANARTTSVPNVGDKGIGPLVTVPREGQPYFVFVRNVASPVVFIAHDKNSLASLSTLSNAFKLRQGEFMVTVLAPGQQLFAGSDPANDGVQGTISYTTFAAPFWMAGIPVK